jgi:hypothetical protein
MDIQELKERGEKYSSIVYVDSAKRNRVFFPTAQKYEVNFNEPFRNVFSVQVLDASIPRTHYNVDVHNNSFCYVTNNVERELFLDIGDYTETEIVDHMNNQLVGVTINFLSSPADRRKQFVLLSDNPFEVKPFKTTMRELLGFDQGMEHTLYSAKDPNIFPTTLVTDTRTGSAGLRVNVDSSDIVLYQKVLMTDSGKIGAFSFDLFKNDTSLTETNEFDLRLRLIRVDTNQEMARVTVPSSAFSDLVHIDPSQWEHYGTLIGGQQYVLVISTLNATYVNYDIVVDIVSNNTQQLYLKQGVTTDFDLASFLESTENTVNAYGSPQTVEERYFGITSNTVGVNMGIQCTLTTVQEVYSLVPPGIYNLLGDRYIVLRCKEIENHIMSSLKSFNGINPDTETFEEKQYETGIAKFKMSVVGFREERFDFNTLPPQEFHPIGKLSSLTFAFENQDGIPYDFKGVNHTITMSINYYKPILK